MPKDKAIAGLMAEALYGPGREGLEPPPAYLNREGPRACAHRIAFAYLAWALPESPSRGGLGEVARLDELSRLILAFQHEDGTVDSDNFHSPPDTAFVCDTLEATLRIASRTLPAGAPSRAPIGDAIDRITLFCDRAAEALAVGGVHTPNHRWVVCGVLAQAYRRTGKAAYRERCLDWLGEGIDIDADGQFSERSSGIYSPVTCQSLIRMADGLAKPELLDAVRRNLETALKLIQPGGYVETLASRRQDQAQTAHLSRQVFPFAYMAARDGDARFAWAARLGLERLGEAMECLPSLLAYCPGREGEDWGLPEASEPVTEYRAFLPSAGLLRIRSGEIDLSVYGGSDLAHDPRLPESSGIASNPAVLGFRNGKAVCRWLRLRPRYFDLPAARFFLESFDGERAVLTWKRTVPYFAPLPREWRKPDGDYELSTGDGRFWSKMAFGDRPWINGQSLEARLAVSPSAAGCTADFALSANARAQAFLELAFDAGCEVSMAPAGSGGEGRGLVVASGSDSFRVLSEGEGLWVDITGSPTGEAGRHASLRDGEGAPMKLKRWAFEFEAPCRLALSFEARLG
jgi:hypothetical protein